MRSNLATQIFSARGPLALLGIVLHLCTFYNVNNPFPVVRDNHWITAVLSDLIHVFRMETFMLIAGVAFTILVKKYTAIDFYWNRVKRLILPLVAFALLINYPLYLLFADTSTAHEISLTNAPGQLVVMHLWFLRDLFMITVFAGLLYYATPFETLLPRKRIGQTIENNQILVIAALPFLLVIPRCFGYLFPVVAMSSNTFGSIESLMRYSIFFFIGALTLYMPMIARTFENPTKKGALAALIIFAAAWIVSGIDFQHIAGKVISYAARQLCTLIFVTLSIQLCHRVSRHFKKWLPTLDEASYSIYLLHLPLLILVANAVGPLQLAIGLEMPLIFAVTTFLCFGLHRFAQNSLRWFRGLAVYSRA